MLQLVLGIHRPQEGEILVHGEPIPDDLVHFRRKIIGYRGAECWVVPSYDHL